MTESVKDTLIRHGFHFSKKFGQNFITDNNLLDAIVEDANITEEDTVVEVGAGAGTLTRAIAKRAKKVISYEIDTNLKGVLADRLADLDNVEVRFKDVMSCTLSEFEEIGEFKVVANLPYYITTPITMFFLEKCKNAKSITIMVQKEVAERLIAKQDTEEYGAITAVVDYYGDAKITRNVSRKMFYPVPNVDSSVLNIVKRQKYAPIDENLFLKTVKTAFLMRRKTLANNLMQGFKISRDLAEKVIQKTGFNVKVRGEVLSTEDFVKLSDNLKEELQ